MDFARTFLAWDLRTNLEVKEEAKYEIREEATRSLLHQENNPGTSSIFVERTGEGSCGYGRERKGENEEGVG